LTFASARIEAAARGFDRAAMVHRPAGERRQSLDARETNAKIVPVTGPVRSSARRVEMRPIEQFNASSAAAREGSICRRYLAATRQAWEVGACQVFAGFQDVPSIPASRLLAPADAVTYLA
jgi:hypothetical protein